MWPTYILRKKVNKICLWPLHFWNLVSKRRHISQTLPVFNLTFTTVKLELPQMITKVISRLQTATNRGTGDTRNHLTLDVWLIHYCGFPSSVRRSVINSKGQCDLLSSSCLSATILFWGFQCSSTHSASCRPVKYLPVCVCARACLWGWVSWFHLIVSISTYFHITFFLANFPLFPSDKTWC